MNCLILMVGVSGSGKSTFINQMNWQQYTINPDTLRLMIAGQDEKGFISQKADNVVWPIAYKILNWKLKNGKIAVFDATNINRRSINQLIETAKQYNVPVVIVDTMLDCTIEMAKERNRTRHYYQRVPEEVIERQWQSYCKMNKKGLPKIYSRQEAFNLGIEGMIKEAYNV